MDGSHRFVPYVRREGYILNHVPDLHLRRLQDRAYRLHTSVADVMVSLLAARYGLGYHPSGRPPRGATTKSLSLRLPVEVIAAVRKEAESRNVTIRTVMLDAVSDSFRLKRPAPTSVTPGKRPGRPPTVRRK